MPIPVEKENAEFNEVYSAQSTLKSYIESGKKIDIIKMAKVQRYDVWKCVFEHEPEAYALLQEKEIYEIFIECKKEIKSDDELGSVARYSVCFLEKMLEFDSPLQVEKAINIILEVMGLSFINYIIEKSDQSVERRKKIISKYQELNQKWIDQYCQLNKLLKSKKSV